MATESDGYFDLSPTDRSMAVLDRHSPVTFHVIWDLVGEVDLEAISWAYQALAKVHPIIGSSADIEVDARWTPSDEPLPMRWLDRDEDPTDEPPTGESAIPIDLITAPIDVTKGPTVSLSAVPHRRGLRLILAAHHAAFDGAASVVLLDDFRRIYLGRRSGRQAFLEPDLSPRTVKSALRQSGLPLLTQQGIIIKSLDRWRRLPPSTHVDPSPLPAQVATGYVTIDLGPALGSLDQQRRRNSWPMDAVLVGLLEAAWNETFGRTEDGAGVWLVATDLRHDLGLTAGIGNLGGVEPIAVRQPEARPVERLIEQAAAEIAATRSGFPGLGPEVLARSWTLLPPSLLNQGAQAMIRSGLRNRYTRTISNLGRLPDSLADWGQARMEGLRYLGPMARGPYCMFVAFSQGTSSWLTVRTAPDWFSVDHAHQLEATINRQCGLMPSAHAPSKAF
jgi:hypothetical protein